MSEDCSDSEVSTDRQLKVVIVGDGASGHPSPQGVPSRCGCWPWWATAGVKETSLSVGKRTHKKNTRHIELTI